MAREALMERGLGRWLLFAVAAGLTARLAWPASPDRLATVIARMDVIAIVLLLAGLPCLAHRFLGPASDSRLARFLRVAASWASFARRLPSNRPVARRAAADRWARADA
jgi:hypothetical protein